MKKFLAFSLTIFLFFQLFLTGSPTEVLAAPTDEVLTLYAQSAVLIDADTGRRE